MDLVAEMLLLNLQTARGATRRRDRIASSPWRVVSPGCRSSGETATADTADRILNRVWDYPRWLRSRAGDFDLFHIIDHSYAHLATRLPAGRSLVTLPRPGRLSRRAPGSDGGSIVQRALGRRLLEGMKRRGRSCAGAPPRATSWCRRRPYPPNASSSCHTACIPRAALDPSLTPIERRRRFSVRPAAIGRAAARRQHDSAQAHRRAAERRRRPAQEESGRSVDPGWAALHDSQRRLAGRLGLDDHVTVLPFVSPRVLAAVYRRAALLLQTSDREGFGLPVAEAMACGTPVVASDLPALREVGGPATTYCPVGDVERWTAAAAVLLEERADDPGRWRARQAEGIAWARRFDWQAHARATVDVYRELLSSAGIGQRLPRRADVSDEPLAGPAPRKVLSAGPGRHGDGPADPLSRRAAGRPDARPRDEPLTQDESRGRGRRAGHARRRAR